MKLIKIVAFLLVTLSSLISYANENTQVLIGQNESEGLSKTAFVLELLGDNLENCVLVSESGEVYLKADKILAIPKEAFSHFTGPNEFIGFEEGDERCGSRVTPKKWQCPYCHYWWDFGEKCRNKDCPTNQWDKK